MKLPNRLLPAQVVEPAQWVVKWLRVGIAGIGWILVSAVDASYSQCRLFEAFKNITVLQVQRGVAGDDPRLVGFLAIDVLIVLVLIVARVMDVGGCAVPAPSLLS